MTDKNQVAIAKAALRRAALTYAEAIAEVTRAAKDPLSSGAYLVTTAKAVEAADDDLAKYALNYGSNFDDSDDHK